ncbi:MAG: DUF3795 domain-containing protein [Anaerolineae bacterium]
MNDVHPEVDLTLAAVCGLFCPACIIYIAAHETPEKRAEIARQRNRPVESLVCDGCRAERRYSYCESCKLYACATAKGLDFCGQCAEYPCADLKAFQAARPHRLELWEAQARIREVGYEQWFAEMIERYACPECGTLNSAYHLACRACGAEPANAYVAEHKSAIVNWQK